MNTMLNKCLVFMFVYIINSNLPFVNAFTSRPPFKNSTNGTSSTPSAVGSVLHCGNNNTGAFRNGISVTFYCYFESETSIFYSDWIHNGRNITASFHGSRIITTTETHPGFRNDRITFNPLLSRDSGKLEYKLYSSTGPWNNTFNISIEQAPVIRVTPLSSSAELMSDLTITCNLTNHNSCCQSPYQLLWYKNSVSFPGTVIHGKPWLTFLQFKNVQKTDEGTYKCGLKDKPDVYMSTTIYVITKDVIPCNKDTDNRGTVWDITAPGQTQTKFCPAGFTGFVIRTCSLQDDGSGNWEIPNYLDCVKSEIVEIENQLKDLESGFGSEEASIIINTAIDNLYVLSNTTELTSGDILKSSDILFTIVDTSNNYQNVDLNQNELVGIIDNMLSDKNLKQWDEINKQSNKSGSIVLNLVSKFGAVIGNKLPTGQSITVKANNLDVLIQNSPTTADIYFPNNADTSENYGALINFPKENINEQVSNVISTSAVFKTVSSILPVNARNINQSSFVGSVVLGFSLEVPLSGKLKRNISMTFQTYQKTLINPQIECVFWNFSLDDGEGWSTDGCNLMKSSSGSATCSCNHLTNFAILMSPSSIQGKDAQALGIISIIGCSISIAGLLLTVIIHIILWRYVKNGRTVLLVNLCVALASANLIFLVAVDKVQYEELCAFITALLHYLYLVVFFTMFAKGVLIFIAVKLVFKTQSKIKLLMFLIWGVPVAIVSITVGVSYSKEYHSDTYCWLTLTNGVLYAFVAPVLLIIVANVVIIIFVLHVMYTSSSLKAKSRHKKAKTGLRSMCTLLPILGVTWAFGLLSINEDLVVFQYLFAITNSLQGLFIFIFHCFLSPQVRNAMRNRMRRYEIKSKMSDNFASNEQNLASTTSSGV